MKDHMTLEQLEKTVWGPPEYASYLVTTCHRLRQKPIRDFTNEVLRIMIGQDIGLMYLLPRALDILDDDPLAEGDFYPGDLLAAVLKSRSEPMGKPELKRLTNICQSAQRTGRDLPKELQNAISAALG